MTPAIKGPPTAVPLPWNMEFGYGVLRRVRLLVDGPGRSLWVIPASTVTEVTLAGKGPRRESQMVLKRAMSDAIANNDAAAVRALAAAGVPLEPAKVAFVSAQRKPTDGIIKSIQVQGSICYRVVHCFHREPATGEHIVSTQHDGAAV